MRQLTSAHLSTTLFARPTTHESDGTAWCSGVSRGPEIIPVAPKSTPSAPLTTHYRPSVPRLVQLRSKGTKGLQSVRRASTGPPDIFYILPLSVRIYKGWREWAWTEETQDGRPEQRTWVAETGRTPAGAGAQPSHPPTPEVAS